MPETLTEPEVAEGQLWRSQNRGRLVEVVEVPEGEFLLGEVAMLMPVKVAKLRHLESPVREFWVRQLDLGHDYLRIPEADERYDTAEEAKAAQIDGWGLSCRRCGGFGARVIQAKDRLTLCHNHATEWKLMLDQHDRERKAFYG